MVVIATDLDRTLIPNGDEIYDNSLPLFKKIVNKNDFSLIYITGRNLGLVKKAIKKFDLPKPDYILTNVGTRIYYKSLFGFFKCDKKWFKIISKKTPCWDFDKIKDLLKDIKGLTLQENKKQDKFKLSFYVDIQKKDFVLKKVKEKLRDFKELKAVFSLDYPEKRGLLDILPDCTTKINALNYVIKNLEVEKSEVVCCGDSGNDISLLTSEYKAILVRNASEDLKKEVEQKKKNKHNLYIAKEQENLNGNYASGILQGLVYFNFISKKDLNIKNNSKNQ